MACNWIKEKGKIVGVQGSNGEKSPLFEQLTEQFGVKAAIDYYSITQTEDFKEIFTSAQDLAELRQKQETAKQLQKQDVRFQIIGEQGANNLKNAKTTLKNLRVAREMTLGGKDAKTIKIATGWELGVDNKWRMEIDSKSIFKNVKIPRNEYYEALFQKKQIALKNLFKNQELFRLYPALEDYKVVLFKSKEAEGFHNSVEKILGLSILNKDFKTVLTHEIQHAIQQFEGFAVGGSPRLFTKVESKNKEYDRITKEIQEIFSNNSIEWEANIKQPMVEFLRSGSQEQFTDELVQKGNYAQLIDLLEDYRRIVYSTDDKYTLSPEQQYERMAGEVEARNVETRMEMTMEDKRSLLLSETEDVAREDQIVIEQALGMIEMSINRPTLSNQLLKTGLAKNIYSMTNAQIEAKLVELGVDSAVAKQIIGEQGASRVEEYNSLLSQAKELERQGEDYSSTGWFKTINEDWKYFSNEYVNQFKLKNNLKINQEQNFEDVIEDNIIFQIYPQSRKLKIVLYDNNYKNSLDKGRIQEINGAYSKEQNTIFVNIKNADGKSMEHIIGHELNHFSQGMEGFPTGGSKISALIYALETTNYNRDTSGNVRDYLNNYDKSTLTNNDVKAVESAIKVYDAFDKKDEKALLSYYDRIEGEVDSRAVELAVTLKNKFGNTKATYKQLLDETLKKDGIDPSEVISLYYKGFEYNNSKNSNKTAGFTFDNDVYLNNDVATQATQIHEFSHLYNNWLKENKPEVYNKGISLIQEELKDKNSPIKEVIDFVKTNQPNLRGEALEEEIIAELLGRKGLELINEKVGGRSGILNWLEEVWVEIKQMLGISKMSNEDVMNLNLDKYLEAISVDLLSGENIKGDYMKAPNGKPTNLTEFQWNQVRTPAFKEWFGDWENDPENASKVVDENGEPLVVYHGTEKKFNIFDKNKTKEDVFHFGTKATANERIKFSGSKDNTLIATFLNIRNMARTGDFFEGKPLPKSKVKNLIEKFNNREHLVQENELIRRFENIIAGNAPKLYEYYSEITGLSKESYESYLKDAIRGLKENREQLSYESNKEVEGLIYKNTEEGIGQDSYLVFEPNQIKSATENNGEFSTENNDIRFQKTEPSLNYLMSYISQENQTEETLSPQNQIDLQDFENFDKVKVLEAFYDEQNIFSVNVDKLVKSGVYNRYEATNLRDDVSLQQVVKESLERLKNTNDIEYQEVEVERETLNEFNSFGKLKKANPYIQDEQMVKDSVTMTEDEFMENYPEKEKPEGFKKSDVFIQDGSEIRQERKTETEKTLPLVVKMKDNSLLLDRISLLNGIETRILIDNSEDTVKVLQEIENDLVGRGIDAVGLTSLSIDENLKTYLEAVRRFTTSPTEENTKMFADVSDIIFDRDLTPKVQAIKTEIELEYVNLETTLSEEEVYNQQGLVRLYGNTWAKTAKEDLEGLYENVRTYKEKYKKRTKKELERSNPIITSKEVFDDKKVQEAKRAFEAYSGRILPMSANYAYLEGLMEYLDSSEILEQLNYDIVSEDYNVNEKEIRELLKRYEKAYDRLSKDNSVELEDYVQELIGAYNFENSETAEAVALYKIYFDATNEQTIEPSRTVDNFKGDYNYLTNDYIADFYSKYLKEKQKDSKMFRDFYTNFEVNEKGINLKNTDEITMQKVQAYVDENLRQYSLLSKQMPDLTIREEAPISNPRIDAINNPQSVEVNKNQLLRVNDNEVVLKDATKKFLRINNQIYEAIQRVGNIASYARLNSNNSNYNAVQVEFPQSTINIENYRYLENKPEKYLTVKQGERPKELNCI